MRQTGSKRVDSQSTPKTSRYSRRATAACCTVAALSALGLAGWGDRIAGIGSLLLLLLHALGFLAAVVLVIPLLSQRARPLLLLAAALTLSLGLGALLPLPSGAARAWTLLAHGLAGGGVLLGLTRWLIPRGAGPVPRHGMGIACLVFCLSPVAALLAGERRGAAWQPPRYDAAACYRFLTATTAEQAGETGFPTALRRKEGSEAGCEQAGCHPGLEETHSVRGHAAGIRNPAYRTTLADFERRKGREAARWCRGCHEPDDVRQAVGCAECHSAQEVHAGFGNAALVLDGVSGRRAEGSGLRAFWSDLDTRLRPRSHAARLLRPAMHRSAEFCGSCHRKHWNLPQNQFRWLEGPDEYRAWQASRFSGTSLFAVGEATEARSCVGCHDPHGSARKVAGRPEPLRLDLFLRRDPAGPRDAESSTHRARGAGGKGEWRASDFLDVVVHNSGVGHDFPYGMPDLHEAWLEVEVTDRMGRLRARSGGVDPDGTLDPHAHVYRLVALDRRGKRVDHGNLDERVSVREWRRIPAGESDLARYQLPELPLAGGEVRVRLLRRRRPLFSRWVGEDAKPPEVLAEAVAGLEQLREQTGMTGERLRRYGMALATVKAYPEAIRLLLRAREGGEGAAETDLALGRVFLLEGDLLAAREAFQRAAGGRVSGAPVGISAEVRARAWEAAVLRRMGQPDAAARRLRDLAKRYPRDRQLRFELGLTLMALLKHQDAAREFAAMLDVDPLDVSAHYNLMLCQQRLNRLTAAQREETVYRLLADTGSPSPKQAASSGPGAVEERPLHVHELEIVP